MSVCDDKGGGKRSPNEKQDGNFLHQSPAAAAAAAAQMPFYRGVYQLSSPWAQPSQGIVLPNVHHPATVAPSSSPSTCSAKTLGTLQPLQAQDITERFGASLPYPIAEIHRVGFQQSSPWMQPSQIFFPHHDHHAATVDPGSSSALYSTTREILRFPHAHVRTREELSASLPYSGAATSPSANTRYQPTAPYHVNGGHHARQGADAYGFQCFSPPPSKLHPPSHVTDQQVGECNNTGTHPKLVNQREKVNDSVTDYSGGSESAEEKKGPHWDRTGHTEVHRTQSLHTYSLNNDNITKIQFKANRFGNRASLDRQDEKNAKSRARAALRRERTELIQEKDPSERTEEEEKLLRRFCDARHRKKSRSRDREKKVKERIVRILAQPSLERTQSDVQFLDEQTSRKRRKQSMDRQRRLRLKNNG